MLFVIFITNLANGSMWVTFAPISSATAKYYGTSVLVIDMLSVVFMVAYIPLGFTSQWFLDTISFKWGLILGAVLTCIGSWLRFISSMFFGHHGPGALLVLFLGQILAACAQPFLLNAPPKMATMWFTVEGRATADMVGTIGNIIGVGLASGISGALANVPDSTTTNLNGTTFPFMLVVFAGICSFAALAAVILTEERPPTAPSASADQKATPFRRGLVTILGNKAYLVVLVTFGIGLGIFNTITTVLDQMVLPLGYNEDDTSLFLAILVGVGLVSAGVTAPILDTYHRYIETYIFAFILASLAFLWFSLVAMFRPQPEYMIIPPLVLLGIAAFMILPTALELSVELSYPVSASTSVGFLWMAGQIVGIISLFVSNVFFDSFDTKTHGATYAIWFNLSLVAVGTLLTFILLHLKPEYKRYNAETLLK
jgi:FLVCR family MFS transporter 7